MLIIILNELILQYICKRMMRDSMAIDPFGEILYHKKKEVDEFKIQM